MLHEYLFPRNSTEMIILQNESSVRPLSAAAGLDDHLGEGLQHEAVVVIGEEDGEALHLTGHAAGLRQLQTLLVRSRQYI